MIIQHNITALNAYNRLSTNNSVVSKNLEKLSSGFRINRAGDDAAGLAISEKMRAQITGLDRAKLNAQDGISLVQTAEGALTEVHSMLNRLVELDTQSANGTYQEEDRGKIQSEVDALLEEIDRISQATNFNGINLLDGSLSSTSSSGVASGKMVATVSGTIGALKTGIDDQPQASGVYEADLTGTMGTTVLTTADAIQFDVTYVDTNGKEQTKTLYAAAPAGALTDEGLSTAISTAIGADEDLKKLFTATTGVGDKLILTATNGGTNGAQFKGIAVTKVVSAANHSLAGSAAAIKTSAKLETVTTTVATDATSRDIIDFNGWAPAAGATITIGEKTYEFFAAGGDATSVSKGNIAVSLDLAVPTVAGSVDNLVKSLQANGVKSASVTTGAAAGAGEGIKIGNLSEINAREKTANIITNSNGLVLSNVTANAETSQFTVGIGSGNKTSFEVSYQDEEGKERKISLTYTSVGGANGDANAAAIRAAITGNDTLNKLFTVGGADAEVVLTAKTVGANGAKMKGVSSNDVDSRSISGFQVTQAGRDAGQTLAIRADQMSAGDTISMGGKTFQFVTKDNMSSLEGNNIAVLLDPLSNSNTAANLNLAFQKNGVDIQYNSGTNSFFVPNDSKVSNSGGLILQVGDTNEAFNKVTVSVEDMSVKGLGIENLLVTDQGIAGESIDRVKSAIEKVSVNRGNLGALQNRLEHTINNLTVTSENMTAAESRIRDTDMAKEMMSFTKNNVLVQAAQAMLAQANQQPQQVLQLLR